MDIKDLVYEITPSEILPLKKEITFLHDRELFERHIYFQQITKLTGDIVEILKRLNSQEEEHAYLLKILLEKSDLPVKEYNQDELIDIVDQPADATIKYDIDQEKISADAYKKAIARSNGKIKQLLEHILQEEFDHIGILEKYLEEL